MVNGERLRLDEADTGDILWQLGLVSQRAAVGGAMTGWPGQPVIYEINTAVWLDELSRTAGRPVTLAGVAAAAWDAAVPAGVDAVWLMGVWGGARLGWRWRSPMPSCSDQSRPGHGVQLAAWPAGGQVLPA